jgi:hypothetical protein
LSTSFTFPATFTLIFAMATPFVLGDSDYIVSQADEKSTGCRIDVLIKKESHTVTAAM